MELIYTTRNSGFEQGRQYRNPQYFDRIEQATSVVLDGDLPTVRKAYEAADIHVRTLGTSAESDDDKAQGEGESSKPLTVAQIKEALAAKEIEIPAGVAKRDDLLALLEAAE